MRAVSLFRETLASVSRWRGQCVIVHVDLNPPNGEKDTSRIISDVLLLKNAGVGVTFACMGKNAPAFVQKAENRGVDTVVVDKLSDLVALTSSLNATKVFFLGEGDGIYNSQHLLIREMTTQEAENMLCQSVIHGALAEKVHLAVHLCEGCVQRVHFANGRKDGAFLDEFLSSKGSGTMIYRNDPPYKRIRKAVSDDVVNITHIIREAVDSSIVEEVVLRRISDCAVFTVDGHVHACVLSSHKDAVIKVEYLANSVEFDASEVLQALLQYIIDDAITHEAKKITVEPIRVPALIGIWPWFLKLGFKKNSSSSRNHKLWEKNLES